MVIRGGDEGGGIAIVEDRKTEAGEAGGDAAKARTDGLDVQVQRGEREACLRPRATMYPGTRRA